MKKIINNNNNNIWILGIIVGLILIMILLSFFGNETSCNFGAGGINGGYSNMMGTESFGLFGFIEMFLFWILILGAFIFIINFFLNKEKMQIKERPFEIINRRYANGEISKKEYESMKRELIK